jgi:hypothetical protein
MALENGGLDAQVEQRMDAYRSNPQQLQQRYGQNKELLDLLALQKLTSEKQAAARDMQMKMQQQPGTIAQQREQEALELTKQEMGGTLGELAGRTKGTLDQKQAMQQQNMQKMAQGQPPVAQGGIGALMGGQQARPPMQGVPPQAQGLANARMQAPVQMAKGGIVSFADGEEVTSPASRWFKNLKDKFKAGSAEAALRQEVQSKYGTFSSAIGGLRSQSDEQRQYAKDVIASLNKFSVSELQQLADAKFTPGMTDLSALPVLPTTSADSALDTAPVPPAVLDPSISQQPTTSDLSFLPPQEEDFFAGLDPTYDTVAPAEVDRSRLTASEDDLRANMGEVPEMAALPELTANEMTAAPLEYVEPPYNEQQQEMLRSLTQSYANDMGLDPEAALAAARGSSDTYFGRADKAKARAEQLTAERDLQGETLSRERLRAIQRADIMAGAGTLGGMRKANAKGEREIDTRRAEGLATLRDIENTAQTDDTGIASYGAAAGQNAAARASSAKSAALLGTKGLLNDQLNLSREQQAIQNDTAKANLGELGATDRTNYQHQSAVVQGNFTAARDALNRDSDARNTFVKSNMTEFNSQVNVAISEAEDENAARKAGVENQIDIAAKKSEERLSKNKALMESQDRLVTLLEEQRTKLRTDIKDVMLNNPEVLALQDELTRLAGTENKAAADKVKARLNDIFEATKITYGGFFADAFGELFALEKLVAQRGGGNSMTNNLPSALDPNDPSISFEQQ